MRRVESIGAALKALRGARKPMAIAKAALGADSDKKQRRDFVNYLLRVERGEVQSPGFGWLQLFAAGFECAELSEFFQQLEMSDKNISKDEESDGAAVSSNTANIDEPNHGRRSTLPTDILGDVRSALYATANNLYALAARLDPPQREVSTPRRAPPRDSGRPRKAGR